MTTSDPAGRSTGPSMTTVRTLAVWALLLFATVTLAFGLLLWLTPDGTGDLAHRSLNWYFVNVYLVVCPVLAVLLAAYGSPPLRITRTAAIIAFALYAVALGCGVVSLVVGARVAFDVPGPPSGAWGTACRPTG